MDNSKKTAELSETELDDVQGGADGSKPIESFSLNFEKIKRSADGTSTKVMGSSEGNDI